MDNDKKELTLEDFNNIVRDDDWDKRFDLEFSKYDGVPMQVDEFLNLLKKMREFE